MFNVIDDLTNLLWCSCIAQSAVDAATDMVYQQAVESFAEHLIHVSRGVAKTFGVLVELLREFIDLSFVH
jgi:hypothetical protein